MKAIIIGGGIGGLTTAIALEKLGHEVEVYEAAPAFKPVGAGLALAANAVKAFGHLGIEDSVLKAGQLIPSVQVLEMTGRVISQMDSLRLNAKYGINNFAIHRADLHEVLLSQLKTTRLFTNRKAEGFTETNKGVEVIFHDGTTAHGDCVIASDGIHSAIRRQLQPSATPRYAGYTCWRAVVPQPKKPVEAPSETWGNGSRFGIVPLTGNRIYWFATLNAPQNDARIKNFTKRDLLQQYAGYHEPVAELIESANEKEIIWGDIIDLPPQKKFAYGKVLLLGDAAHATTPNMGQGACQAIEDAAFLYSLLKKGNGVEQTFAEFEKLRVPRTTKIVEGSWRVGKIAQWENALAVKVRNGLMRMVPASTQEKQMKFLYEVEF